MATAIQLPLDEYLQTTYRPDCDYIDGELLERNKGETPHSTLQSFFCWYFRNRRDQWLMRDYPEQRVEIAPTRYRIPDFCLVPLSTPVGLILTSPPILCVEILSREDRVNDIQDRIDDYLQMGVSSVWVINPWRRKAFYATPDGSLIHEPQTLRVPNTPIELPVADIFQELDPILSE